MDQQITPDWPSAKLIGERFVGWDADSGTMEVAFVAPPEFANMRGSVQGGFVAAFLDEAMGAALFAATGGKLQLTLELNLSLLRPVPLGPLTAKARVLKAGSRVAFLESELFDANGTLCARATATSLPGDWPQKTGDA